MTTSETFDAKALRLLAFIDKKTRGKEEPIHLINDVGLVKYKEIGLSEEDTIAAWRYLREKNRIKIFNLIGAPYPALINANGIDVIEKAREQNKDELIEVIYDKGGGQISKPVLVGDIRALFDHWVKDTFFDTLQALEDAKLILLGGRTSLTATVVLTPDGRRRAKKLIHPTPPFTQNILNIVGTVSNSPIQQGGAYTNMTQTVSYSPEDLDDLRRLVEVFDQYLDDLALEASVKREVMAQVAIIKAQLEHEPNIGIVKQAGRTLRNITEGAIGSLIVAAAGNPAVWAWTETILTKLFGGP